MPVRWFIDNKIVGVGIGTVERVKNYSPDYWWDGSGGDTLYFNFGSALRIDAFAILTNPGKNGTVFVGYGHGYGTYTGTVLATVYGGTAKAVFNVGTYQYWKVGLFDPDEPTVSYDRVDEIFLGRHDSPGEQPDYPFERRVSYELGMNEGKTGERFGYRENKRKSWRFVYTNARANTKDKILHLVGTAQGGENPFWLSVSDDETDIFLGRFDQESFVFEEVIKNSWNMGFDVKELK